MKNVRPEDKLLITCTRQAFPEEHKNVVVEICSNGKLNWNVVYSMAVLHGVAPLICSNLRQCPDIQHKIPQKIMEKFHIAVLRNILMKENMVKKITEVLSFFHRKNIDVMLIKGSALDILIYDDPWVMCSEDVDVIVKKRKEEMGKQELSEYYSMFKHLKLFEPGYFEHHDLDMNGILPINYQKIWHDATKINFKGQYVFVMSPEDMLISACINSCRKRFFRLKNLCDIAELIKKYRDLHWEDVTSKTKEYCCQNIVYTALLITKMTVGCEFPEEVLYRLHVSSTRAKILSYLSRRMLFSSLSSLYSGIHLFGKPVNLSLILPYATYDWYQILQHLKVVYTMTLYERRRKQKLKQTR